MKNIVIEKLKKDKLIAVIRGKNDIDAYNISKEVILGGIKIIELTFSTPFVQNSIEKLSKEYEGSDVLIGAGTVLDEVTAKLAIGAGAKFIVSPHLDEKISVLCNRYDIPYLPGCMTITEIVKAISSGASVVKLFPGDLLGPKFIKNVKGPLPYVNMMPSGGVSIDNMKEWLDNGAIALGIGSALTSKGHENIREITEKFVKKLEEITK